MSDYRIVSLHTETRQYSTYTQEVFSVRVVSEAAYQQMQAAYSGNTGSTGVLRGVISSSAHVSLDVLISVQESFLAAGREVATMALSGYELLHDVALAAGSAAVSAGQAILDPLQAGAGVVLENLKVGALTLIYASGWPVPEEDLDTIPDEGIEFPCVGGGRIVVPPFGDWGIVTLPLASSTYSSVTDVGQATMKAPWRPVWGVPAMYDEYHFLNRPVVYDVATDSYVDSIDSPVDCANETRYGLWHYANSLSVPGGHVEVYSVYKNIYVPSGLVVFRTGAGGRTGGRVYPKKEVIITEFIKKHFTPGGGALSLSSGLLLFDDGKHLRVRRGYVHV